MSISLILDQEFGPLVRIGNVKQQTWIMLCEKWSYCSCENTDPCQPTQAVLSRHCLLFFIFCMSKDNPTFWFSLLVNPFPHKDTFWRPWETSLLKTLWEKEKLLITSNFSFTHRVFYQFRELFAIYIKFKIVVCRLFQFGPVWLLIILQEEGCGKQWEKEKMLVTGIFSFSHRVFYPSQKEFLFSSYIHFVVCRCFQLGQSQNLLFGKELNPQLPEYGWNVSVYIH